MRQKSYAQEESILYLIPTPIGNMEDITLRAVHLLERVDFILCEDTRVTRELLNYLHIKKKLIHCDDHNEEQVKQMVVERLKDKAVIGLVTDRGTPIISDPGYRVSRYVIESGFPVVSLPGATAFVPALTMSGLSPAPFLFYGFLNSKKGKRDQELNALKNYPCTMIFYESPYRLVKTLAQFAELFGPDREASVSRELTKKFEENVRGTLRELIVHFSAREVKGEIVIVLGGKPRKAKREDADNGAVDDAEENGLQED